MACPNRLGVVGLLLAVLGGDWPGLSSGRHFEDGQAAIALAAWGRIPYVFVVIGMALGLAQLELVLRASREPVRHRLKFIVIGLGGLAGYQIYQASQMLLFPVWQAEHVLVSSVVTAMALVSDRLRVGANRLREVLVNTYVSQQALFGSVTFIVIGLYLLAVGAVGEWIRQTNQPLGVGLSVLVVFGSLVGLAVAAFSKTVRAEIRRFLDEELLSIEIRLPREMASGHRGLSAGGEQRGDHGSPARPLNQDLRRPPPSQSGRFGTQIGGFASIRFDDC